MSSAQSPIRARRFHDVTGVPATTVNGANLTTRSLPRAYGALPGSIAIAALVLTSGACVRSPQAVEPAPVARPVAGTLVPGDTISAPPATLAATVPETLPATPDSAVDVSPRVVTRQTIALFGDTVAPPPVADSTAGGEAPPSWDIDVRPWETHARVEHYVALFSGEAGRRITQRLEQGTRYDAMIRAKFRNGGLPEDMSYLALVESGYNPNAYSRAAAVGMWQFMTSTAKGMGLRVDWWVDERRDPIRSTDAAVRFIRGLRDQFGSLYLAAAAYNGGPGRVARGLSKYAETLSEVTGNARFFALAEQEYLPSETKNYVPQIIAAAIVAKDPVRYGLRLTSRSPYVYDTVRVPASTPVAAVAAAAGVPTETISELNPHVLRGVTPPGASFVMRVPTGAAQEFETKFAALPAEDRKAFARRAVHKGETLSRAAASAGITARQFGWYNRGLRTTRKGVIRPGQTVTVPSASVVSGARDVPDPALEIYGSSARRAGRATVHVVRRGENLGGIAKRYGTTVKSLTRLNRLKKPVIYPGQSIIVRGATASRARSTSSKARKSTRASSSSRSKSASGRKATPATRRAPPAAKKRTAPARGTTP